MNIYDIKLEGDTVTLTFDDKTVRTFKETSDSPSAEVPEVAAEPVAPSEPETAPVEAPAKIVPEEPAEVAA